MLASEAAFVLPLASRLVILDPGAAVATSGCSGALQIENLKISAPSAFGVSNRDCLQSRLEPGSWLLVRVPLPPSGLRLRMGTHARVLN
jgi:hypothetical protein